MAYDIGNSYWAGSIHCMDESVAARVKRMRVALGFDTQGALAAKMGVDQSKVSDIERGKGMGADILMRLAAALECSAEMVMQGHDTKTWPFDRIQIERYTGLDETERVFIQGRLLTLIEEAERDSLARDAQLLAKAKMKPQASPKRGKGKAG